MVLYPRNDLVVSAGAVVFDTTGTRVLTIVNRGDGTDSVLFPKGRVEPGESFEEAARREVKKETGVVCQIWPGGPVGVESRYSEAIGKTKLVYWYAATHVETQDQKLEDHEQFDVVWTNTANAGQVLSFADDRQLLGLCIEAMASQERAAAHPSRGCSG
ncbi:hypothetical protein GGF46_005015 [Coemansia sp. RSA 552]|nr:hypothetical protein GGF46_005015 [Coemansia sp. RSA 552]